MCLGGEEPRERGGGAAWQSCGDIGWEEAGSPPPACPPAPLLPPPAPPRLRSPPPGRGRPATLPRRPVASPSGVRPLFPIARPSPPRPSRLAPRVRGWGGEGVGSASSPRPHPTPRAFRPVAPATTASPHKGRGSARRGSSGRVWRAVRRGGRRLPVAGPLALPRRLPSPALGRSASAGRRPAVRLPLWACRAGRQAPRLPTPSEPRGFLPPRPPPPTPPAAVCPVLPPCSRLSRTSDACPLPAWRPAPRRSPFPPPSVVVCGGGGGCPGTRVRVGVPPADGLGREDGVRRGRPHRVCEGWRGGGGLCPASRGGDGGGVVVWRRRGPPGPAVGRRAAGHPLRSRAGGAEARVRPRARWGDAAVGGRRRGVGPWGVPCPSPASPFPGT